MQHRCTLKYQRLFTQWLLINIIPLGNGKQHRYVINKLTSKSSILSSSRSSLFHPARLISLPLALRTSATMQKSMAASRSRLPQALRWFLKAAAQWQRSTSAGERRSDRREGRSRGGREEEEVEEPWNLRKEIIFEWDLGG